MDGTLQQTHARVGGRRTVDASAIATRNTNLVVILLTFSFTALAMAVAASALAVEQPASVHPAGAAHAQDGSTSGSGHDDPESHGAAATAH